MISNNCFILHCVWTWHKFYYIITIWSIVICWYHTKNFLHQLKYHIFSKVRSGLSKGRTQFGFKVPSNSDESIKIDNKGGETYWKYKINKEIDNSHIFFNFFIPNDNLLPGYKEVSCRLFSDMKSDGNRKSCCIVGIHLAWPPYSMMYVSVFSRDSVRIDFIVTALNDLDVLAGDIQNPYLSRNV